MIAQLTTLERQRAIMMLVSLACVGLFLVGYGMDAEGRLRGLPYIAAAD